MSFSDDIKFETSVVIEAPAHTVWGALVEKEKVAHFYFAPLYKIELEEGGEIVYGTGNEILISGEVVEVEPAKTLSHTFRFGPKNHEGTEGDKTTLVTYRLSDEPKGTNLKLTHSGFAEMNQTYANVTGGWPVILENLKKYLETE